MASNVVSPNLAQNKTRTQRDLHPRRRKVIRAPTFSPLSLLRNLSVLAEYKELLYTLSVHRIKVRYKQSQLGLAWAILQPLSLMLIYTLIFSKIVEMPSDGSPYAIFAYTALLPWTYFSTALTGATSALVTYSNLVTKVYFPREILPLTNVIAALFDFAVASTVLAALMLYYGISLTLYAFYAIPIILVLTCLITAVSLFLSAAQVSLRDIGMAIPLLLQVWMFATPIVYPLSRVPDGLRPFYILNPMVGVIENFRRVVLQGQPPDFYLLGVSTLAALILLPASYIYFKHTEATIADTV